MATNGQFYWPSVGSSVAAYGQFRMAANTQPLDQSRVTASYVISSVARHANPTELLGIAGQKALQRALRLELRDFAGDILGLANAIASTARMLATVEWRNAGYRPRDTPTVELSSLEAAIVIHLWAAFENWSVSAFEK